MADPIPERQAPVWERLYLPLALLLLGFGVLGMFSIGLPFFVMGIAMVALWPLRDRRRAFVPLLVGALAFVVVGVLAAPLGCKTTVTGPGGHTTCDNILGLTYEGSGLYNAPLWPAVAAGAASGTIATLLLYLFIRRDRSA